MTLDLLHNGHIRPMDELKREIVQHALDLYDGSVVKVSRHLGIGRSTIYRFMAEETNKKEDV